MKYTSVDVDVDIDAILESMGRDEIVALVAELIDDGYMPDDWGHPVLANMENPAVRLDAIRWLRDNGWKVEP